jgi:hypothetical protein
MVYNTMDYWVFGLRPSSGILKNITFLETVSETFAFFRIPDDEVQKPVILRLLIFICDI